MKKARVIAFYLPQFHPTPDNDKWWGKGFTEWTNVAKAKPLFKGHYQPHIPADLGFYDLRLPEVREAQAAMARDAGIEGFCYYHYWFGNGKQELERPFNEVLASGHPDFPFCLCWANESWHAKFWNKDGSIKEKKMLQEQTYPGKEDIINHFYSLLTAFKDSRYIQVDGKPLFMIYRPYDIPDLQEFTGIWNDLARQNGLEGIYFVGQIEKNFRQSVQSLALQGIDAINIVRLFYAQREKSFFKYLYNVFRQKILKRSRLYSYRTLFSYFIDETIDQEENIYPTIIPNWDHSPRSGKAAYILHGSTPEYFKKHVKQALMAVRQKQEEHRIIFLKSWNEWGEGNYMEPDLKFGHQYLDAFKDAIKSND